MCTNTETCVPLLLRLLLRCSRSRLRCSDAIKRGQGLTRTVPLGRSCESRFGIELTVDAVVAIDWIDGYRGNQPGRRSFSGRRHASLDVDEPGEAVSNLRASSGSRHDRSLVGPVRPEDRRASTWQDVRMRGCLSWLRCWASGASGCSRGAFEASGQSRRDVGQVREEEHGYEAPGLGSSARCG